MSRLVHGVLVLVSAFVSLWPERWLSMWAGLMSRLWFSVIRYRRRVILENIERAFPELAATEKRRLGRAACRHLLMCLLEFLRMRRYKRQGFEGLFTIDGLDHFKRAEARGRGICVVTGHLGSWELTAAAFAHTFPGTEVHLVVKGFSEGVQAFVEGQRKTGQLSLIPARGGLKPLLAALKRNALVVFVMDQNSTRKLGVFVDFFSESACTMSALATIALRTGCAVVPCAGRRVAPGRHHLEFFEAIEAPSGGPLKARITELTQRYTTFIEGRIRACPEQWLWTHRRWKTRPKPG